MDKKKLTLQAIQTAINKRDKVLLLKDLQIIAHDLGY